MFKLAVDALVEEQGAEEKEEMLSKLPELTDIERTDRERIQNKVAKVKNRRSFGPRLVHLA